MPSTSELQPVYAVHTMHSYVCESRPQQGQPASLTSFAKLSILSLHLEQGPEDNYFHHTLEGLTSLPCLQDLSLTLTGAD